MLGLEYILELYNTSQTEIAELLNIKVQNISRWIKGERNIPEKYIGVLSEKFEIPSEYIIKQVDEIDKLEIQEMKLEHENPKTMHYEKFKAINGEIVDLEVEKYVADVQAKIDSIRRQIRKLKLLNSISEVLDDNDKSFIVTYMLFSRIVYLYDSFDQFVSRVLIDVIDGLELVSMKEEEDIFINRLANTDDPIARDVALLLHKYCLDNEGKIVLKNNWKEELYNIHKQLDSLKQD